MITSINSNNSLEYRGLFEEATSDLVKRAKELRSNIFEGQNLELLLLFINRFPGGKDFTEETIENITDEEIEEIVKISTLNDYFCNIVELSGINTQYIVLPLDEEIFEIDANSRAITVPATFKKNGVGVQGDHTAETVHFVIDRYFDSIDLAADDLFIAIQYEGVKGIQGLDPAVFKDVTTLQNKVIFGWIIDDEVTKMPGNVKFSIHFFKGELDKETGKITNVKYSFNTLPATVAINKAFEFDLASFDPQRDPSQLVIDRLTNSKADGAVEALAPVFVINLPVGKVDLKDVDGVDENTETYTFNALAHSEDAGYIDYTWYRDDGKEVVEIPGKIDYILTEDEAPVENKLYYYIDANGDYVRLGRGDTFVEGEDYYERRAFCEADRVGIYFVVIKNTVGTSSYTIESNRVEIPRPAMPAANKIVLEVYDAATRYGFDAEVGYVRATKELDTEETLRIAAEANEGETLSYQWYKVVGAIENDIEIPVEKELERIDGAVEAEYTPEETGWYTVNLIGGRNGAFVEFPTEKYYRLTSMPEVPVVVEEEGVDRVDVFLPLGQEARIEIEDLEYSDKVVYKWYKDVEPYFEHNVENDVLLNIPEDATVISNAELYNYIGDVLYCIPVNIYNKVEIAGAPSRRFFIMQSEADRPEIV